MNLQHGVLATEGGQLFIEPTSHNQEALDYGRQHTISKSSAAPPPSRECAAEKTSHTYSRETKRRKRLVTAPESYVETVVVADQSMLHFHERENLEAYIFTLMNIVRKDLVLHATP